jgi:valyl-tRNA synthetase
MTLSPQGHDIITFWLFNTVAKSKMHEQKNPWEKIMIMGHALDPHGKKMSKSKGNVVEPQVVLAKYGADALRFWAAASKLGDDLPFMEKDLVTGQKMVTKLWNASSFCLMHLKDFKVEKFTKKKLKPMDRWMLAKLNKVIKEATDAFEVYEYARTRFCTEQFFWKDFCDYYLEIVKDRIYNPGRRGEEQREAAQYGLYIGILSVLKLMAPIMPHITEAVYQEYFAKKEKCKSIHISSWPVVDTSGIHTEDEEIGDMIVALVGAVRKVKSEKKVSLKEPIKELVIECASDKQKLLEACFDDLAATTSSQKISFGKGEREVGNGLKMSVVF